MKYFTYFTKTIFQTAVPLLLPKLITSFITTAQINGTVKQLPSCSTILRISIWKLERYNDAYDTQQSKSSLPFIHYTLFTILPFSVFISVPRGVLPQVITHQANGFMCHPSKVSYTNLPCFHIAITKSPSFRYFVTETMATHEKCYAIKRWQEFISPLWINHWVISDGYCRTLDTDFHNFSCESGRTICVTYNRTTLVI